MTDFSFADRYAEAGLAPAPQVIGMRQAAADRIVGDVTSGQVLDLAGVYFGSPGLDLAWLREAFALEDASFSLVNNEREARVLSAAMLGALVAAGKSVPILAIVAGGVGGLRQPAEATWLVRDAAQALARISVSDRRPGKLETKVAATATPKLAEEIAAVPADDWPALLAVLGKIRTEALTSAKNTSAQTTAALTALSTQAKFQREETQMLWWLLGGHSRSLERGFGHFGQQQAALIGAADLGALTTASRLGPVAAPAMLERVIAMARRPKGVAPRDLASAVDGFSADELDRLPVLPEAVPARIAPVTAAIVLARGMGAGAWHARFRERTGIDPATPIEPLRMAEQLYREHLLGQLL